MAVSEGSPTVGGNTSARDAGAKVTTASMAEVKVADGTSVKYAFSSSSSASTTAATDSSAVRGSLWFTKARIQAGTGSGVGVSGGDVRLIVNSRGQIIYAPPTVKDDTLPTDILEYVAHPFASCNGIINLNPFRWNF